jgi:hypothetical protein
MSIEEDWLPIELGSLRIRNRNPPVLVPRVSVDGMEIQVLPRSARSQSAAGTASPGVQSAFSPGDMQKPAVLTQTKAVNQSGTRARASEAVEPGRVHNFPNACLTSLSPTKLQGSAD